MKNDILIVYKSKTGFTKRYAEMVAKRLTCTLADYRTITPGLLSQYDTVVFGSRAYAGRIDGYRKAMKLFQKSGVRSVALFVTGAAPNEAEDVIKQLWSQNLTAEELERIPHFYMQSGLCYEQMSLPDRLMMKMAAALMKKKKDKNAHEKEFEQAIAGSYDISSETYAEPLISFLRTGA